MQFLLDNFIMLSVVVFSGVMLIWSFIGNKVRGITEIDTAAALQLINHKGALVLDVREQNEFDSGHILKAKLIPLGKLSSRLKELESYRDKPIVVACRSGQRSASACTLLNKEGYTQVHNLGGGVTAWQKAKLPLER
ncbi:Thiosulfate sulfurtransferase GlpE [Ferriphaselus amnicola]|uniref:Thiosulfate sulfurtransferase GlpE n=1 Tax=Ferriphaselus amnicola TaxID=1188319 RepID=A0A2Z6G8D4_9PROT|nr:rhodanese-like domain-containing protein [Ferriphaselus amnicola]BBE49654.1 Thiosulfate sulfurtransferase GlpE [Ferriphaselus amnicola]